LRAHSGVESRGEANGLFANLAKFHAIFSRLRLTAFEPKRSFALSLDVRCLTEVAAAEVRQAPPQSRLAAQPSTLSTVKHPKSASARCRLQQKRSPILSILRTKSFVREPQELIQLQSEFISHQAHALAEQSKDLEQNIVQATKEMGKTTSRTISETSRMGAEAA
jgi:hypothetical protein